MTYLAKIRKIHWSVKNGLPVSIYLKQQNLFNKLFAKIHQEINRIALNELFQNGILFKFNFKI